MATDINTGSPSDQGIIAEYPADERTHRSNLESFWTAEHEATGEHGRHTLVSLPDIAEPTLPAGRMALYAKDVGGEVYLFIKSSTGVETQIGGPDGILISALEDPAGSDLNFANDFGVTGETTGSGPVRMVKVDPSDELIVGDATITKVAILAAANDAVEINGGEVWHLNNQGDGSGLDADLVGLCPNAQMLRGNTGNYEEVSIAFDTGFVSAAHALGVFPQMVQTFLRFKVGNAHSYDVGDCVAVGAGGIASSQVTTHGDGFAFGWSDAQVWSNALPNVFWNEKGAAANTSPLAGTDADIVFRLWK